MVSQWLLSFATYGEIGVGAFVVIRILGVGYREGVGACCSSVVTW